MDILIENWYMIVYGICIIVIGVFAVKKFMELAPSAQLDKIKTWLYQAVVEAEKAYGDGMGEYQLSVVYTLFTEKFPMLKYFITMDVFTGLVDECVDAMKDKLKSNSKMTEYVSGTEVSEHVPE